MWYCVVGGKCLRGRKWKPEEGREGPNGEMCSVGRIKIQAIKVVARKERNEKKRKGGKSKQRGNKTKRKESKKQWEIKNEKDTNE
jgi:hypothetical protein